MPVTIEVNEPIGGTWRMLQSSHEWNKTSAWAAQFIGAGRGRQAGGAEVQGQGHLLKNWLTPKLPMSIMNFMTRRTLGNSTLELDADRPGRMGHWRRVAVWVGPAG